MHSIMINFKAPLPNQVFVFGSNLKGIHGAGAAKDAFDRYGAVWGKGEGHYGRSYALPTKDFFIQTLALNRVKEYVDTFIAYAKFNSELNFFVTKVGCGLAGYSDKDIAPMFIDAPDNCELPEGWRGMNSKLATLESNQKHQ